MKNDEEAGFFSLINETISSDDLNFTDLIVIFKLLANEKINEEDTTNDLKEILLEGGYELKEIKYKYTNKLNIINKDDISSKGSILEDKNLLINSLSQLQTFKNDLIICCLTPLLYFKNGAKYNFNVFWDKKINSINSYNIISKFSLIYFSNTKIRGLYDSQYLFPNLYKVKHIFQLIISKSEKENKFFNMHLS